MDFKQSNKHMETCHESLSLLNCYLFMFEIVHVMFYLFFVVHYIEGKISHNWRIERPTWHCHLNSILIGKIVIGKYHLKVWWHLVDLFANCCVWIIGHNSTDLKFITLQCIYSSKWYEISNSIIFINKILDSYSENFAQFERVIL